VARQALWCGSEEAGGRIIALAVFSEKSASLEYAPEQLANMEAAAGKLGS
jgi:hypothetical protein